MISHYFMELGLFCQETLKQFKFGTPEPKECLPGLGACCSVEHMSTSRLQMALAALANAIAETNAAIEEMRRQHDPLASHIFISRRRYQNVSDTKSGKRHHVSAQLSWQQACELGFHGNLEEWERLLSAASRRQ